MGWPVVPRHDDHHRGSHDADPPPFWAHARIDRTQLVVVTALARAVAQSRAPGDVADRFGDVLATAAATLLEDGDVTFDLWEEPGRLVCHLARGSRTDGLAGRRLRVVEETASPEPDALRSGIVVECDTGGTTAWLPIPPE
jgi:hypothetical protein